jgi:hypothetical protein
VGVHSVKRSPRVCRVLVVAAALLASAVGVSKTARADDDVQAFARVVVADAELRSGPGVSYRVISTAHRGDTLALDGRQGQGFWLRVLLDDGRVAYALGDELSVFAVDPGQPDGPSRPGLFAPPPLTGSHGGLAILGGALSIPIAGMGQKAYGFMEIKPSVVISESLSVDAFAADALTADGSQVLYGAGASFYLAPHWPVCPFLELDGGGYSVFPANDSFVLKRQDLFLGRAGGGLLLALRNRILVRLEVTNLTLFSPSTFFNAQTYSGGFGVYF